MIVQNVIDEEGWQFARHIITTPSLLRERINKIREKIQKERKQKADPVAIQAVIDDLQTQITNLFKLAKFATDDDSIAQLGADMNELEEQKRQVQALFYDAQEEEEEAAKLEAEIQSFECWLASRRELLTDPSYVPTWQEKRKAIKSLGIQCTVFPASGNFPFRRQFDFIPPEIMKLLTLYSDFPLG